MLDPQEAIARMTPKQRAFCEYYLQNCNASESARLAGYSLRSAFRSGQENLHKPVIRAYIDYMLEQMADARIAKAEEVLERLTSVMRGEETEPVPYLKGNGEQGFSEQRPKVSDRVKAAELLGRRYALFTDNAKVDIAPVVISGESGLEG